MAAFLDGVGHDELVRLDGRSPEYERIPGDRTPGAPADEAFWVASAVGADPLLEWEPTDGTWVAVLMNADGRPGLAADVDVAGKVGALFPIAFSMLALGAVAVAIAVALIIVATRRPTDAPVVATTAPSAVAGMGEPTVSYEHPVSVAATLDPDLSRWRWLVKWFLAIPHLVVLAFLWIAFVALDVRRRRGDPVHRALPAGDLRLQRRGAAVDLAGVVLRHERRPRHRPLPAVQPRARARLSGRARHRLPGAAVARPRAGEVVAPGAAALRRARRPRRRSGRLDERQRFVDVRLPAVCSAC